MASTGFFHVIGDLATNRHCQVDVIECLANRFGANANLIKEHVGGFAEE